MINDLIRIFRESGLTVTESTAALAERKFLQLYHGETVYVADQSRQVRARQLAQLGQMETRKIATLTGLSVRTIRRIRNGK